MKRSATTIVLVTILFYSSCFAQNPNQNIDKLAHQYMTKNDATCIAIGYVDHGQAKFYSCGTLSKTSAIPADSNTLFEAGSVTKVFTAISVAKAVNEKKGLSYTDRLSQWLPAQVHAPDYYGQQITILNLLNHSAALPSVPGNLDSTEIPFDLMNPYLHYTRKELYAFLNRYRLTEKPGSKYDYSNLGMGLAGDILCRYRADTYEHIIRKDILMPFGMNRTFIAVTESDKGNFAQPNTAAGKPVQNWDFDVMAPAGAIKSCSLDLTRFITHNMYLGKEPDSLLKKAMLDCQRTTIHAGKNLEVGLGWHISPMDNDTLIWHNGGTGGYRSFIGFNKTYKTAIVVLANTDEMVDDLAIKILHELDKRQESFPNPNLVH